METSAKGILYPASLPTFHRIAAPRAVADFVQWFWIPEWAIEPGRVSRQQLLSFPTSNLVVEAGATTVEFAGPTTRAGHRDLSGSGWAVGALLRPAAVPFVISLLDPPTRPEDLRDRSAHLVLDGLRAPVAAAMSGADAGAVAGPGAGPEHRRHAAVDAFVDWLAAVIPEPTDDALLANRMMDVIAGDADVTSPSDAAAILSVSPRTLQRLAKTFVGLSPAALIRRRRLQDAADRVRSDPGVDLAGIAAEYGYADHAHLTNDFRRMLGFTPSSYRRSLAD